MGFCIPSSPWMKAWGNAWGDVQPQVMRWRSTANFRDKFSVGKLMIPANMFAFLVSEIGYKGAKSSIDPFQKTILDLVENNIPRVEGEYKGITRPYVRQDWALPRML